jgi:hypothetical protein
MSEVQEGDQKKAKKHRDHTRRSKCRAELACKHQDREDDGRR